jgi:hypothetical protein
MNCLKSLTHSVDAPIVQSVLALSPHAWGWTAIPTDEGFVQEFSPLAWIETVRVTAVTQPISVASRAEAWIETSFVTACFIAKSSRIRALKPGMHAVAGYSVERDGSLLSLGVPVY